MRTKIRMPKGPTNKSVKFESRYITVTASEYELMNFIGACLFARSKTTLYK